MTGFKPWKVVDGHYPSFREVKGAAFNISVVMTAIDISFEQSMERERDLELIAEAGTVRAETGLTPAQLQARVAELEAALEGAITQTDKLGGNSLVYRHIRWGTP